jgi:hypothetical protein
MTRGIWPTLLLLAVLVLHSCSGACVAHTRAPVYGTPGRRCLASIHGVFCVEAPNARTADATPFRRTAQLTGITVSVSDNFYESPLWMNQTLPLTPPFSLTVTDYTVEVPFIVHAIYVEPVAQGVA